VWPAGEALETMLRIYCRQNWYAARAIPLTKQTSYDSNARCRFAGIVLCDDQVPDETTIPNFRHLLERNARLKRSSQR
jgi:IS5 family transposase